MTQDTVNQLKTSAKNLGRELQALGYPAISHTHLLHALSRATGFESWNAMRAAATSTPPAPATLLHVRPYPEQYVSEVFHANGRKVEVVRWEDPVVGLGDHYYVYDAETFQCLTPTADLVFGTAHYEMPSYEDIVTLLDQLQDSTRCAVCGNFSNAYDDDALPEGAACSCEGCDGEMVPFFKD